MTNPATLSRLSNDMTRSLMSDMVKTRNHDYLITRAATTLRTIQPRFINLTTQDIDAMLADTPTFRNSGHIIEQCEVVL
jgi:hypothetical protein